MNEFNREALVGILRLQEISSSVGSPRAGEREQTVECDLLILAPQGDPRFSDNSGGAIFLKGHEQAVLNRDKAEHPWNVCGTRANELQRKGGFGRRLSGFDGRTTRQSQCQGESDETQALLCLAHTPFSFSSKTLAANGFTMY